MLTEDKKAPASVQDRESTEEINLERAETHWKRDYRRGLLQLMVLMIIKTQTQNAHGYGLIKVIRAAGIHIKAGTIYPLLKRLEDAKLIKVHLAGDPTQSMLARKIYTITTKGELMIDRMIDIYSRYNAFVDELYQKIMKEKR